MAIFFNKKVQHDKKCTELKFMRDVSYKATVGCTVIPHMIVLRVSIFKDLGKYTFLFYFVGEKII